MAFTWDLQVAPVSFWTVPQDVQTPNLPWVFQGRQSEVTKRIAVKPDNSGTDPFGQT